MVGPSSLPVVVAPVKLMTCKPSMNADAVYAHLPALAGGRAASALAIRIAMESMQ